MINYIVYNNGILLYKGFSKEEEFESILKKYDFGSYKIEVIKNN